jgi:ATP-dependent helicase HrpB
VRRSILSGFPDRVGKRRRSGHPEIVLAQGGSAKLSEASVVHEGELLVAVAADEQSVAGRGQGAVRLCTSIEPDWLLEDFGSRIEMKDELGFNPESERVERREGMVFGAIALDEARSIAAPSEQASRLLFDAAKSRGLFTAMAGEHLLGLGARLALLRQHFPEAGLPDVSQGLDDQAALALCQGRVSFAELRELDPARELRQSLGPVAERLLASEAPESLLLPGGRRIEIHYEAGKPPWIESRLQDFFGMKDGPRLCRGQVPLTLHLLAPNGRAQQVTSDLSGFWERHYPSVRRELMRKYPRHPWPEDGKTATPPVWQPRTGGRK